VISYIKTNIGTVKAVSELESLRTSIVYKFPSFDLEAARRAGLTDEKIAVELGEALHFDTEGALKEGATLTQIIEYVSAVVAKPSTPSIDPSKVLWDDEPNGKSERNMFDKLNSHSPVAELSSVRRYTVKESQTGITINFKWYETEPPTEGDLDEVFIVALGVSYAKSTRMILPALPKSFVLDNTTNVRCVILTKRKEKLSENESTLVSKLQRIGELKEILESQKNSKQDFLFLFGMTLFPPVALLILGMGFMWVFSGFVPKQSR